MKYKIGMIFLILLIILNIGDFFDILPGDVDFVEKIFSIIALGILFYLANLADIFFGEKNKKIDFLIILSCFSFMVKDIIAYAETSLNIEHFLIPSVKGFFLFLQDNVVLFERASFYFAGILILVVSIYCALKIEVKAPSIMHMIHEDFPPSNIFRIIIRLISIFFIITAFYLLVFNLVMQWLAAAIDAPQLMLLILVYAVLLVWHKITLRTETIIHKLGELGIDFYKRFIQLFHYRSTVFFGISGLLVLHVIMEIGVFVTSYVTGVFDPLYFERLGYGHSALFTLIKDDLIANPALIEQISILWVYFFNVIALVFLLFTPVFAWYTLFKKKELHIPKIFLAIICLSLVIFWIMPSFALAQIHGGQITGVDITTKSILSENFTTVILSKLPLPPSVTAAIISIITGIVVIIIDLKRKIRKNLYLGAIYFGLAFFGYYLYLFSSDLLRYHITSIAAFFHSGNYFFLFYFSIFFILTLVFYVAGYVIFLYEIYSEHMYDKWSREI